MISLNNDFIVSHNDPLKKPCTKCGAVVTMSNMSRHKKSKKCTLNSPDTKIVSGNPGQSLIKTKLCPICGKEVNISNMSHHQKSKKCRSVSTGKELSRAPRRKKYGGIGKCVSITTKLLPNYTNELLKNHSSFFTKEKDCEPYFYPDDYDIETSPNNINHYSKTSKWKPLTIDIPIDSDQHPDFMSPCYFLPLNFSDSPTYSPTSHTDY